MFRAARRLPAACVSRRSRVRFDRGERIGGSVARRREDSFLRPVACTFRLHLLVRVMLETDVATTIRASHVRSILLIRRVQRTPERGMNMRGYLRKSVDRSNQTPSQVRFKAIPVAQDAGASPVYVGVVDASVSGRKKQILSRIIRP